jgi:hypothetical protein
MSSSEWAVAHPEKMREYRRKNYHAHKEARAKTRRRGTPDPVKQHARWIAQGAYRRGRIVKPAACEGCNREKRLHMHHDDYSRPLAVTFLCVDCHALRHRALEQKP